MIAEETVVARERLWGQLIARVWADEDFKQRLLLDPHGVLAEAGIDVPDGVDIKVVEDTPTVRHLVLPPAPADDLIEEDLSGDNPMVADSFSGFSGGCGRCGCGGCGGCRGCD